jgi:hypothetical protein
MLTRRHAISLMAAKSRSAGAIRFAIAPYELRRGRRLARLS